METSTGFVNVKSMKPSFRVTNVFKFWSTIMLVSGDAFPLSVLIVTLLVIILLLSDQTCNSVNVIVDWLFDFFCPIQSAPYPMIFFGPHERFSHRNGVENHWTLAPLLLQHITYFPHPINFDSDLLGFDSIVVDRVLQGEEKWGK